jgi:hypothetical protein
MALHGNIVCTSYVSTRDLFEQDGDEQTKQNKIAAASPERRTKDFINPAWLTGWLARCGCEQEDDERRCDGQHKRQQE